MSVVQLCVCARPLPDLDGYCLYCAKALVQPDVLDIPRSRGGPGSGHDRTDGVKLRRGVGTVPASAYASKRYWR